METDIVVYDTNILIDIYTMGLLDHCARWGVRIHTTSLVCNEIVSEEQRTAIEKYLVLNVFRYDSIEQYNVLQNFISGFANKSNLSMPDFSVLKLAKDLSAPLYTADKRLRNIAKQYGVETYGSLHIVVELNAIGILSKDEAFVALDLLQKTNRRISENIIEEVKMQLR